MIRLFDRSTHPSAAKTRSAALGLLLAGCVAAVGGCDLSDSGAVSLQIVKPVDGQTFTSKDDVDPKTDGTQIDVTVAVVGVDADAIVELYRLEAGEPAAGTLAAATIADNQATFSAFNLEPGENQLQARIKDSERTSDSISVKFEDSCGSLSFIEPSAAAETVRLGPRDDEDDEPCGETFTTRVVARTGLTDKTQVALLVNGKVGSTAMSEGGVVTFDDVVLGNRGDTPNRLALKIPGSSCGEVELDADVIVACAGPSCSLGGPTPNDLSSADDQDSATAGLQADFDVQTDAQGEDVMLLINGDADNAKKAVATGGKATFASVSLPEGKGVRVKAVCTDEIGLTGSDERVFNVDTTACVVAITSPEANDAFLAAQPSADVAPSATRDINVTATVGNDCVSYQIASLGTAKCEGIANVTAETLAAGQTAIDTDVALETQGAQHVCVQVADSAGNTAIASIPVTFDKVSPALNFTSPTGALSVNIAGTDGRVADQNPATPACDRAMSVSCSENGSPVQILTATDKIVLASAVCTNGAVSFASVPLPTKNDGSSYTIIARSTGANTLIGSSAPRSITADCQAQALRFSNITCGTSVLRTADDVDPVADGIQFDVNVENNPSPRPTVSLTISGLPASPATSGTVNGQNTVFDNTTFTLNTAPALRACTSDSAGNASCTPDCALIVGNVPFITFTAPAANALLSRDLTGEGVAYRNGVVPASSDCDAGTAGLQIAVSATTDAPNGRSAQIKLMPDSKTDSTPISTLGTTVAGGAVSGCINTADGSDLVIRVEVDHTTPGVFGVATRTVSIDGNAPATPVTLQGTPPSCRGNAALGFVEVFDAPGQGGAQRRLVGWEQRCSYSNIVDEAGWNAGTLATNFPIAVDASANPLNFTWAARTRPDATRYCVVRGYDPAGALSPLGNPLAVTAPPLEERTIALSCVSNGMSCIAMAEGATSAPFNGLRAAAVGDTNDDGFDDMLVAGGKQSVPGAAALYLGSASGLSLTPAATFVSESANNLGNSLLGIGDFNADGFDDFALGSTSRRMLFLIFGRAVWPGTPVVVDTAGGCSADVCIAGDFNFSRALTVTNFDFDALPDVVSSSTEEGARVATVVLGSTTFQPNPSLGAGAGRCLDARAINGTPLSGCTDATEPRGFRISVPDAPWSVAAVANRLYIAHRGDEPTSAPAAKVWEVEGTAYKQGSGLQKIASTQLRLVHTLGASTLFDKALSPIGDFDGDGRFDLAGGIDTNDGRFYVYPGQPDGSVAFTAGTPAAQVGYVYSNDLAGSAGDLFGDDIALGYHPIFGLLGDIDNDGYGDILTSSQEEGTTTAGSVDIFYGSTDKTQSRVRSSRSNFFNDSTLLNQAQTNPTYWRRAEYIGDVDADGNNDIAITEENYTNGGQNGRVLILGECNAP